MRRLTFLIAEVAAALAFTSFARESDLQIAREALRDGLWSVARTHAERVLEAPRAEVLVNEAEEAELVILESFASENRWNDLKVALAKMPVVSTNSAFAYYRAASEGRLDDALVILCAGGVSTGIAAKMLEADLLVRKGAMDTAKALWREVLTETNLTDRVRAVASVNIGDVEAMRTAYGTIEVPSLRRMVGLRLGRALIGETSTCEEGEKLIRAIVADSPDAEGAREAFVALAATEIVNARWQEALKCVSDAVEIWPDIAKDARLLECRGTSLMKLGRSEEALQAFARAEAAAEDDQMRARLALKSGEVLSASGRGEEALARYRLILEQYPKTETAVKLKRLVAIREKETTGRTLYGEYRFEDARAVFAEVAREDPASASRMAFYEALCLYGLRRDEEACAKATQLAESCENPEVRADAVRWLAKFMYNRGEWKSAVERFVAYAELRPGSPDSPSALLWATRAAFAAGDFVQAIHLATRLAEKHPSAPEAATALVLQSEALIEQTRFDEAVLVLERVALSATASKEDHLRAGILKADALFALGADNAVRYEGALEAYRAVVFGSDLDADRRLQVAFKIGRVLEKLKRHEEAIDQYYSQVVLAYRDGRLRGIRFGDEARAAFSRAAFRLADLFEGQGRDRSAVDILRLVVVSAVPAADEAARRIERIQKKGRFL